MSPNASRRPRLAREQLLRVVFSPGVAPDKWFGRFDGRMDGWRIASAQADNPLKYVDAGKADIALLRLGAGVEPTPDHHLVRLYEEQTGVAAPKAHPIKEFDTVDAADLTGEMVLYRTPSDGDVDVAQVREHLGVVGANVGLVVAPRPLLRGINQPGVVHRDLVGDLAEVPAVHSVDGSPETAAATEASEPVGTTQIALVWLKERDDEVIQDFVGVCRGRKATSSRQRTARRRR